MNSTLATKAYLTISYGDTPLGTIRLTLRPDIVPRTVQNFVHFLTSPRGYRNSTFHRIIPKFMAQAGDFVNHDGTGSFSIYGQSFADENFHLSHSQRGTLSMANSGKDTNGCQFFISFCPTAHLDGKHVVFGYVDWREDGESADVLDKLERVRTDRRNGDRPLERVQIVDCGILDDNNNKATSSLRQKDNTTTATTEGEKKLAGEAKKNKLLQAYGDKKPAPAADSDEIDLDEEDEQEEDKIDDNNNTKDAGEIDLDDENDEQPVTEENSDQQPAAEDPQVQNNKVSSKKAALQKRLANLRTKINQSRTLNRREVHAEATRMGTEEANLKERKRQNKQDRHSKQSEYEKYVVGKLQSAGGDDIQASADSKAEQKRLASLSQPAIDSIRQMNARSEKKERSQYGVNDYYNPEGQYSNYERNLKAIRHRGAASATTTDSYDPTIVSYANSNDATSASKVSERDGAKRLANEMKRRVEKKINKKRKVEFDETDVSYINDRNKKFNQKIGRNFDEHTAEIRQNLERGTAL